MITRNLLATLSKSVGLNLEKQAFSTTRSTFQNIRHSNLAFNLPLRSPLGLQTRSYSSPSPPARITRPFAPNSNYYPLLFALIVPIGIGSSALLLDGEPFGARGEGQEGSKAVAEEDFMVTPGQVVDERSKHYFTYIVTDYILEPISTARRFIYLVVIFLPVILTSPILILEWIGNGSKSKRRIGGGGGGEKGALQRENAERSTTRWWYRFLVAQMARAGPTFIKLAQWGGSRTDLFPASLCVMFGRLHSFGKPHSLRHTQKLISRAFGKPFDEIFIEFGQHPIGVGAIAQVYRAVLSPDLLPEDYLGPKHTQDPSPTSRLSRTFIPSSDDYKPPKVPTAAVAIKVLHPHVEKTIRRDLKIMSFFATILNAFPGMQWLSFPEEVIVFGEMMMSQVDLRIEANNLSTFENNFRHRPTVSFPRALKRYTSAQVLIEEYEDAVPLEAFLREGGGAFDNRIANLGLDAFLNMLLIGNFCHSDLHPGNILIKFFKPTTKNILASLWAGYTDQSPKRADLASDLENQEGLAIVHRLRALSHDRVAWLAELERLDEEGYQPEIVFIDAGLVTQLNEKNRSDFLDLFTAVASFDGYKAGRLMVERCRAPELVINEETFALRMQHLILSVKSQTFSLAKIRIADILSDVLFNVREHHVKLEPDFVNVVISILLLEGIGRQLDPALDIFKSAVPIIRQLGRQLAPSISTSGIGVKDLGSLVKIWLWIEAREMATMAIGDVDDMLRWDALTPNV